MLSDLFNLKGPQRTIILGSWLGWALDGYDLVLMLFVISSVSQLFFPNVDQKLGLIATFATYAITLVVRPVGAAIFGRFGDRLGRKKSMIISIAGFSLVTFSTGLLPTWEMAGILSPMLLVTLRIAQGIFAGGEWGSGAVITMETVPKGARGVVSGFVQSGFPLGYVLASMTFGFVSVAYQNSAFFEMGWRVMFFTGIIPGIVALLIQLKMHESKLWLEKIQQKKLEKAPLRRVVFGKERKRFFLALIITTGLMYSYYASIGFMPTFLQDYVHLARSETATIMFAAATSSFIGYILSGWISQKIGRIKTIAVFSALAMTLAVPLIDGLYYSSDFSHRMFYVVLLVVLSTAGFGPIPAFLSERFPTEIRNTACGFVFNAGLIAGSWAPLIAVQISSKASSMIPVVVALNLVMGGIVTLVGLKLNPETRNNDLSSI